MAVYCISYNWTPESFSSAQQVKGCVDLRYLVLRAQNVESSSRGEQENPGGMGLGALTKTYLGHQLEKNWRVRVSDWEAESLTGNQVRPEFSFVHV